MVEFLKTKFSTLHKLHIPSSTTLFVGGFLLVSIYVVWWLILLVMFDVETVRQRSFAALEQHLGREIIYSEDVEFTLLPLPKLVMRDVQVPNDPRAQQHNFIQMPKMVITVHPLSIISSDLYIQVELIHPKIEMEVFKDGNSSWQFIHEADKDADIANKYSGVRPAVINYFSLAAGSLKYIYPKVNRSIKLDEIDSTIEFSSNTELRISGVFKMLRSYYKFNIDVGDGNANSDVAKLTANITDGVTQLTVNGSWNRKNNSIQATQQFSTNDVGHFIIGFTENGNQLQTGYAGTGSSAEGLYPAMITSDLVYENGILRFSDLSVEGQYIIGSGSIVADLRSAPKINAYFEFEKLHIANLVSRGVFAEFISKSSRASDFIESRNIDLSESKYTTLPQGIELSLAVKSKQMQIYGMPAQNMQLAADLHDGAIQLKQFSGILPGNTQFLLKGTIAGGFKGLALKGVLDVAGQNINELLRDITGDKLYMPGTGKFRGRASLFMNSAVARFSEGVLRMADVQILGTIIKKQREQGQSTYTNYNASMGDARKTYGGAGYVYEGVFRIDNLDINQWLNTQHISSAHNEEYPKFMLIAQQLSSGTSDDLYQFKLSLRNYKLNGTIYPKAYTEVQIERNNLIISNLQATYGDTYITGDMAYQFVADKLPMLKVRAKINHLDTKEFFGDNVADISQIWQEENGQWSKHEFDFEWLRKFKSEFELSLGALEHAGHKINDLYIKGSLIDSSLAIQNFRAKLWQGNLVADGGLRVSKLPSLYGKFTFEGVEIGELHSVTEIVNDISGKITVEGDFASTGVNMFSMVQNAQGSFAVAAAGIMVRGINLNNMVRAANTVRTVDDVDKLVAYANHGGETIIRHLRGRVNLGNGFLRTTGLQIVTKVGSGSIKGQVDIMNWRTKLSITLYLTALRQTSPPNIRLVFSGPIVGANRTLDTQSLESFIAKQAAERLLEEGG